MEFSYVCNAMTETMRGDKKGFKLTHGADNKFETLKQKVGELPILALPDFNKAFQVKCDASGSTIGILLCQEGKIISFSGGVTAPSCGAKMVTPFLFSLIFNSAYVL